MEFDGRAANGAGCRRKAARIPTKAADQVAESIDCAAKGLAGHECMSYVVFGHNNHTLRIKLGSVFMRGAIGVKAKCFLPLSALT